MTAWRSIGARPDATRGTVAQEMRRAVEALVDGPGVLPDGDSPLVSGTAGWAYEVGSGAWVTQRATGDGLHLWGNSGALSVSSDPATGTPLPSTAPGAGLSRIDVIWVRHLSDSENSDASSEAQVGVTAGAEAASPLAPSIPAGALEIARNTMTSSATSTASSGNTLTQTAPVAALRVDTVDAEIYENVTVLTNTYSASTNIATATPVASVTYDRVLEIEAIVNSNGVSAGAKWQVVVTSSGAVVTSNVIATATLPFSGTAAVGGSATVATSVDLPAGQGCSLRLWVQEITDGGSVTVNASTFKYRIRPKAWRLA